MTDWVTRETRQTGATGQLSSHNKDQGMRLFCPARPSLQVPTRESERQGCLRVLVCHSVCVCMCVCVYAQGTLLLLYLIQVYVVSTASIDYLTLT